MTVSDYFSYLLDDEASRSLAIDLADPYLGRLQVQRTRAAGAAVTARAW